MCLTYLLGTCLKIMFMKKKILMVQHYGISGQVLEGIKLHSFSTYTSRQRTAILLQLSNLSSIFSRKSFKIPKKVHKNSTGAWFIFIPISNGMRIVLAIFCFRGKRKGIILGEPLNIFLGGLQNVSFKLCNYSNRS